MGKYVKNISSIILLAKTLLLTVVVSSVLVENEVTEHKPLPPTPPNPLSKAV